MNLSSSNRRSFGVQSDFNSGMLKIDTSEVDMPIKPFVKRKVRYFVEVDQFEGKATILMSAEDLRSNLEDILKQENLRCVNYFADGISMQKYLDAGVILRKRIDDLFGE